MCTLCIHAGTNDLTNGTNTMSQVRKISKTIQENKDRGKLGTNFEDQIKETNEKLKRFVDNDNINEKSLNKSLLYLNKAGNRLFSKNLLICLKNLRFLNALAHV